ncbi:MAG TPA: GNAT family N-acetyltransferase [Actinomycetota bacterium]|nr:GNAT family N-acetyltransferase [Actinomycetota bacterium]
MEIVRPVDASTFLQLAGPMLSANEARHNLILGLAGTLVAQPEFYPEFRLWIAADAEGTRAAALRTPPHNLVVADTSDRAALEALLAAVREDEGGLPGLVANAPTVDDATEIWTSMTGATIALRFAQGVFVLTAVSDLPRPAGSPRVLHDDDRALVVDWVVAFAREALRHQPLDQARLAGSVDMRLGHDEAGFWLWEVDGTPVSLAGFSGPTTTGIRIGPVYTPPEHRGRGYATALVADLSRELLGRGYRACFLFTDLSNPTSNAIYERIGYRRVADAYEIQFGQPPA